MKKILATFAIVLIYSATAFAEEVEHGGHEHVAGIGSLFWPFVNFLLFVGGLTYLLKEPIRQAWENRRTRIEEAVTLGARQIKAAEETLANAKAQMASLDTDAKALATSISRDAGAESSQILDEAKRRAEFIARQAQENLGAEQRQAEVTLRREIAQRAVEKATGLLKEEITPEVDRGLRMGVVAGVRQLAQ